MAVLTKDIIMKTGMCACGVLGGKRRLFTRLLLVRSGASGRMVRRTRRPAVYIPRGTGVRPMSLSLRRSRLYTSFRPRPFARRGTIRPSRAHVRVPSRIVLGGRPVHRRAGPVFRRRRRCRCRCRCRVVRSSSRPPTEPSLPVRPCAYALSPTPRAKPDPRNSSDNPLSFRQKPPDRDLDLRDRISVSLASGDGRFAVPPCCPASSGRFFPSRNALRIQSIIFS